MSGEPTGIVSGLLSIGRLVDDLSRIKRATAGRDDQPESDTTHSMMTAMAAFYIASQVAPGQRTMKLVMTALIHDLHEARCGDTDSFRITDEDREAKRVREYNARNDTASELPVGFATYIHTAAHPSTCPEAAVAHWVDKMMPKVMHIINMCASLNRRGENDPAKLREYLHKQRDQLVYETMDVLEPVTLQALHDLWNELTEEVCACLSGS